jgi:RHS repeat-associated protein
LTARFTDREPAGFIYSALYYDDRYRVIQRKGNNGQHGTESVYTAYNFEGSPTKEKHVHSVPGQAPVTEVHTYTYDLANRLLKSVYQLNDKDSITLVDNIYDEVGRLFVDRRNGVPELRTNYSYNLRSWLKGVSSPLFSQTLNYQETINDISPCYNGNISSLFWRTAQNNASNALISSPEKGYSFTYDGLSRLKDAVYGEGASLNQNRNRFNEQITGYDKMGNILGLLRYGQTGTDSYGLIDNLNLTYNGNQLQSVYDNATNSVFGNGMEFKDAAHETVEYVYDKNGNLTKDLNKNITEIQYNILNLPSHITFADGNSIVYEYAADGSKVRTTHTINDNVTSTVYCGNAVYENGSLTMLLNESGYYSFQDNKFHFYIKDHQGNIRVVADETGKVDEVNDYYPFGGLMSNVCNNVQSYKYNGKELDRKGGLDWYDYGARHYDAMIGRWHTVDPSAAKYYRWGPYVYCKNSPVNRIDLDGKDDYTINSAGRLFRTVVEGSTSDRLMSTRSGVEPVTVNDKELLSGMYVMQDGKSGGLETYYSTSSLEDAAAVFKFGADNTSVEWKLDVYNDKGDKTAIIGTSGKEGSVFSDKQSELNVKGDKVVDMHSHPYNDKASGQDMNNLKVGIGAVYHRDSKVLFFYDSRNSRIESEEYKIDTSKTLLDKLNDKFMK